MNPAAARTEVAPRTIAPRILFRDPDHSVFTHSRVLVMIWTGETTPTAVNRVGRLLADFSEGLTPRRFCLLTVVEATAPMPPSASRAGLAKLLQVNASSLIRSAVAYEGAGFRAAAIRGVATGIAVLSNHAFPHRIFASISSASEWLSEGLVSELGADMKRNTLADAVQTVRRMPAPA